jgi:uncharacterized protein YggE
MLLCAALGPAAHVARADEPGGRKLEDVPKLTVRGTAELERPADRMQLAIGVVSEGDSPSSVLAENTTRMNAVVAAMRAAGLGKDEYETGRFQIRPKYAKRPRQPEPDWKPTIVGYEVTNTVRVKTRKLDLAGTLIEATTGAGANTAEVSRFDLEDERKFRGEAIREATANALADARMLADAASLDLVRIVAIHMDGPPVVRSQERPVMARAMAEGTGAPPLQPGSVTIRANVTVVYEIAPGSAAIPGAEGTPNG